MVLKVLGASVLLSLSLLAAYFVGLHTNQTHDTLFNNVCLIDKTNVNVLESSLTDLTKSDAQKYGLKRLVKARVKTIKFIEEYRDIAPCDVPVKIPPRRF